MDHEPTNREAAAPSTSLAAGRPPATPGGTGSWQQLFHCSASDCPTLQLPMRVLRRRGHPFLLVPAASPQAAAACLALYPAQTPRARLLKRVTGWLLGRGFAPGMESVSLEVSRDDPFLQFLADSAETPHPPRNARPGAAEAPPVFGVLAGNPATPGQRFLCLVFGAEARPRTVVKAGLTPEARELVRKESAFLADTAARRESIPGIQALLELPHLRAFALNFFNGRTPGKSDEGSLPVLLSSWVDQRKKLPIAELPAWRRLETAAGDDPTFKTCAAAMSARAVTPVLQHGDFAPWNVKIDPDGKWMVLDWERGEPAGIPGWDWFHYVVQHRTLVARFSPGQLFEELRQLLGSPAFLRYAAVTGIAGAEQSLLSAYLLHCIHVIRPSEGLGQIKALLRR